MTRTPDEIKKGIEAMQICHDLITFNPMTGESIDPLFLSEDNRDIYYGIETVLQYIQQLEERIVHLEALNQQNLSVITMQERTRARLEEQISQLESRIPRWISVEEQPEPPEDDVYYCYGYWIGSGRKQAETAEYLGGEWKIVNNFVLTHWMPLPEVPKEE